MILSEFEPDIVQISEQLTKRLNEKKKSINDFLSIIQQRADIEDNYSKNLEKLGNELSKVIENTQQDSFTDIMQYVRNFLFISSEQSKELNQQIKENVLQEIQKSINIDTGWINEVQKIQKRHQLEVRRNIEQLQQLQEEYTQALYEEVRFQKSKLITKKYNYIQSENKLQQFILYYNQYLDQYFQDIAYIQDVFQNIEIDRRKIVQETGIKLFMYEISLIRNLQYDITGIAQKVEQYNSQSKSSELLIIQTSEKPLLSKLNLENYILALQQQVNFTDKKNQIKNSLNDNTDQKKVDFIDRSKPQCMQYNDIFKQALQYSNLNDEIIYQLRCLLSKTKPLQYQEILISSIYKMANFDEKSNKQFELTVTPSGYLTCETLVTILLDYCDSEKCQNGKAIIDLLNLSKRINKMLSVQNQDEQIKFSLFEGLLSHKILKNLNFWKDYVKRQEQLEELRLIQCESGLIEQIKNDLLDKQKKQNNDY